MAFQVAVERRILLYERVDIGVGDRDLHRATRQGFSNRQLIEIARVAIVDRRPEQTL
jgi:hypothetical protein